MLTQLKIAVFLVLTLVSVASYSKTYKSIISPCFSSNIFNYKEYYPRAICNKRPINIIGNTGENTTGRLISINKDIINLQLPGIITVVIPPILTGEIIIVTSPDGITSSGTIDTGIGDAEVIVGTGPGGTGGSGTIETEAGNAEITVGGTGPSSTGGSGTIETGTGSAEVTVGTEPSGATTGGSGTIETGTGSAEFTVGTEPSGATTGGSGTIETGTGSAEVTVGTEPSGATTGGSGTIETEAGNGEVTVATGPDGTGDSGIVDTSTGDEIGIGINPSDEEGTDIEVIIDTEIGNGTVDVITKPNHHKKPITIFSKINLPFIFINIKSNKITIELSDFTDKHGHKPLAGLTINYLFTPAILKITSGQDIYLEGRNIWHNKQLVSIYRDKDPSSNCTFGAGIIICANSNNEITNQKIKSNSKVQANSFTIQKKVDAGTPKLVIDKDQTILIDIKTGTASKLNVDSTTSSGTTVVSQIPINASTVVNTPNTETQPNTTVNAAVNTTVNSTVNAATKAVPPANGTVSGKVPGVAGSLGNITHH